MCVGVEKEMGNANRANPHITNVVVCSLPYILPEFVRFVGSYKAKFAEHRQASREPQGEAGNTLDHRNNKYQNQRAAQRLTRLRSLQLFETQRATLASVNQKCIWVNRFLPRASELFQSVSISNPRWQGGSGSKPTLDNSCHISLRQYDARYA